MGQMKRHYENICNNAWRIYRSLGTKSARGYLVKHGLSTSVAAEILESFRERS